MPTRVIGLVVLASCAGPAAAPRTPTTPAGPSLERIERIARSCARASDTVQVYAAATKNGNRWTSRARVGDQDLAIDPLASTCDGVAITSAATSADRALDDVVSLARTCHHDRADEVLVSFVTGPNATLDRSRFTVAFVAPGPSKTFPVPTFVVDPVGQTCRPQDGLRM